ncbi:UNVERIFIED_CONTAM: hypothetical protein Sindi_0721100 [Sesamum indicum]
MNPPKSQSSSSSLPAGDGETAGEAPTECDGDGTVPGRRKKNTKGRRENPAARVEDEKSGPSPPAETAVFPPTEGRLCVPLGLDERSTVKGGSLGAETAISDPTVGGDASLKGGHGGSSSSSFNLNEFLNLANRVIDHGDEAAMAVLNELKTRWQTFFGDDAKPRQTKTMERSRDRPATGGLRKAVRCLIPPDPELTMVKNGGKAPATLQLPATVTVRVPSTATVGNGHFSCRPAILGGRKAAGNESAAARIPGALFRQLGEWMEPSPATRDVCRKDDVDGYVDTTGGDVAAEVGDMDAEVEKERVADISPSRADVIYDASAEVIHDARADVILDARADVMHDARADVIAYTSDDVIAYTTADVINPRADIINLVGEKSNNLEKKSAQRINHGYHMFILWLAILEKLATTDKPWLSHLGHCVLCNDDMVESHDHLFFH